MAESITAQTAEEFYRSITPDIKDISIKLKKFGITKFLFLTIDADGYVSGNMSEAHTELHRYSKDSAYQIIDTRELGDGEEVEERKTDSGADI